MLKCNGATHSVSLPKKHSITSLEEDEESMVFVNRDAGPSGSKQSGDFDYPGLALADGNSLWMDNDYPQLYRRLADTLGMEFAQISERFGEINLRKPGEDEADTWRFHPALGSAPSTEGAGCLCGSEEKRLAVISKLLISSISILSLFWENSK